MSKSTADLDKRLDAALARWRVTPRDPDPRLRHDSIRLLAEVFVEAPLGKLEALVDRGLALAEFLRAVSDLNDKEVFEAGLCYSGIQESPEMRADPGARIQALVAPARIFLERGMMAEHAICIEAIAGAQKQLERSMHASISCRTALMICEHLGLRQHVPRLLLLIAQVFRDESARGRVDWDTTLSYFTDCDASLNNSGAGKRETNRIRAACLIDGAPCYVEIPRERREQGMGSLEEVRQGIAQARDNIRKGIALAKADPDLGQYVRQGEINLLRLDDIEDALASG